MGNVQCLRNPDELVTMCGRKEATNLRGKQIELIGARADSETEGTALGCMPGLIKQEDLEMDLFLHRKPMEHFSHTCRYMGVVGWLATTRVAQLRTELSTS